MGGPSQDCSPLPAWGREMLLQLPRWAAALLGAGPVTPKPPRLSARVFHSMSWVSARPLSDKIKQLFYTKCPSPVLGFASTPSALGHPWRQSSRSSGSLFTSTDQSYKAAPKPVPFCTEMIQNQGAEFQTGLLMCWAVPWCLHPGRLGRGMPLRVCFSHRSPPPLHCL